MVAQPPVHRCIACRFRVDLCVCQTAPRLRAATQVVVLMHAKEWRRSSNTGHFARLAIEGARVALHGRADLRLAAEDLAPTGTTPLVLFPGRGAEPLTPAFVAALERPASLVVPDGSWGQASQMLKRIPGLAAFRPVSLPGLAAPIERMRRNLAPERMSTFEAVALALGALEGPAAEAALMAFFHRVNARMLHLRGKLPHAAVLAADAAATAPATSG